MPTGRGMAARLLRMRRARLDGATRGAAYEGAGNLLVIPRPNAIDIKKADRSRVNQQEIIPLCVALLMIQKPLLASQATAVTG